MPRQTARLAEPISGDRLYHRRARAAFPVLVRQAEAGRAIIYSDLAEELGMPNPRNLNYPLGSIGRTIENLRKAWKEKVPPLQCLVVNRSTGLPGEGIGWFMRDLGDFASLPRRAQREVVAGAHALIFAYPRWREVLDAVSLRPVEADFTQIVRDATHASGEHGNGESDRHRALKVFVADNPACIGLPKLTSAGDNEVPLPSGDCLDVSFHVAEDWVAAEVKTSLSDAADIKRGLFQCVKYRAVMEAAQAANGQTRSARAILVLEGRLDPALVPLRNTLGIEVREGVTSFKAR